MDWRKNPNWIDLLERLDIAESLVDRIANDLRRFDLHQPIECLSATERLFLERRTDGFALSSHIAEKYGLTKKQASSVYHFFSRKAATQASILQQLGLGMSQGTWRFVAAGKHPCNHQSLDGKTFDIRKGMHFEREMIFPGGDAGCMCIHSSIFPGGNESPGLLQRLKRLFRPSR